MLLVRTTLKNSPIHGLGVFAAEPVTQGQQVWAFDPLIDRLLTMAQYQASPAHMQDYLEHYCEFFPDLGILLLSGDHDRFTNHSDHPNTQVEGTSTPEARVFAARDIAEGEEITCDYGVVRSLKWSRGAAQVA
jgi:SET domain-containing protein